MLYIIVRSMDVLVGQIIIASPEAAIDEVHQICVIVEAVVPLLAVADVFEHLRSGENLPEYHILERFASVVREAVMLLDQNVEPENCITKFKSTALDLPICIGKGETNMMGSLVCRHL